MGLDLEYGVMPCGDSVAGVRQRLLSAVRTDPRGERVIEFSQNQRRNGEVAARRVSD